MPGGERSRDGERLGRGDRLAQGPEIGGFGGQDLVADRLPSLLGIARQEMDEGGEALRVREEVAVHRAYRSDDGCA